jgi:hypothetical protein
MRLGLQVLSLTTILFGAYGTALNNAHPQSARDTKTTPLILEKSEGEHRVRKPREIPIPTGPFTIKVDRKNGGSQKMWLPQRKFLQVELSQGISISARTRCC